MALLQDLIKQVDDPTLRQRIMEEVNKLSKQKKFGLVFEEHLPECTPLYDVEIKRGSKVALKTGQMSDIYIVRSIDGDKAVCEHKTNHVEAEFALDELVAIAEFGEPIYPYLKPLDTVCNAPDSDLWHTLIEADNYHALQLLEYLYGGKVDCIYIDPPYNTGAKDWKYNNDYVDSTDTYRHSKWLSMMKKRLELAKKLLNPADSVLIVTIDEKEYLHLGCLLEEMFPEANMQMISSIIKNGTSMRQYEFSRCNEYIYYLRFGNAVIEKEIPETVTKSIPWRPLMRSGTGTNNFRPARPNSFYPIYVDGNTGRVTEVGQPLLPESIPISTIPPKDGCIVLWPQDKNGNERVWGTSPETLREYFAKGYAKISKSRGKYTVQYITTGVIKDVNEGALIVTGFDEEGGIAGSYIKGKAQMPQNQWNIAAHNATAYGTNLLQEIIGYRFTFPKSLYAVHDCIRYSMKNKRNALIVDFFAGSGTTLHAVNLLNAEDSGHRRCIMVTNNEVSADEAKSLTAQGYHPGDEEWEKLGIARYVTWPRTVCSIEGHDVNGQPLKGAYLGSDIPMSDGFRANAAFFKLGFLDKASVRIGRQFREMLPTLWMKAGCFGPCPTLGGQKVPEYMVLPENHMAILNDNSRYAKFAEEVGNMPEIETVYLVTDSDADYRSMSRGLNVKQTYQLYRDYLDNFRINSRR